MDCQQLATDVREFVRRAYPDIEVRVEPWADDPTRAAVYFIEAQFAALYPMQRYHYLRHLIPADYYERHLADSEWFELAPGEHPGDLEYPDHELIEEITPRRWIKKLLRQGAPGSSRHWTTCCVPPMRRGRVSRVTATTGTRGPWCWNGASARTSCSTCFTS